MLAALNFGIAGFFLYYLVGYSSKLPAAASSPKVGTVAPDFTLRDHTGREVTLSSFRGRNVLLVFYRGHW
ncbi:MAG: hypothetical protein KatS3mg076_2916 [Candidatus Binatia bacterium]|nr:MAG: hypothetical protein KatS3mg076_2916 [Candidatus Binatia bacterium]